MEKFDVFVFGTGSAGQLVAKQCMQAGKKTAIIDVRDYGGTCSQRGCDPKKLMLASMEAFEFAKNMVGNGIVKLPEIDFNAAHNYAKRYTANIPKNTEESFKKAGITCLHGEGSFIGKNTVQVGKKQYQSDIFVIATGLRPMKLGIPGEEFMLTSPDFFELEQPPKKVVFVGAGYVGMEFSHMLHRSGSQVTILEQGNQILGPFENFTANFLEKASSAMGIDIRKNARVSSIEKDGDGRYIVYYYKDDVMHQITTDCVFNTAGRVASIDSLNLEKAGVVIDKNGVIVNSQFQSTSNPNIYACGDVSNQNLPLTPLSSREAKVAADNITKGNREFDYLNIPSVAFTIPNCGGIGMTEKQAERSEKKFKVIEKDASGWFNNKRINAGYYAYKLIIEEETDLILGAHILGKEASEQLNMFAIAMKAGMTLDELQDTIFTYPSWGNDLISY
jgi:glutathione reductase (NADPH)